MMRIKLFGLFIAYAMVALVRPREMVKLLEAAEAGDKAARDKDIRERMNMLVQRAAPGPAGLDTCPISGRKFWGNIDHPERGMIATYGGPFDTYSIPYLDDDNELRLERFDQDRGDWVEGGEPFGWFYDEQQAQECPLPPVGWRCTRRAGHDGPCAAVAE